MNRKILTQLVPYLIFGIALLISCTSKKSTIAQSVPNKPMNVVLILMDDQGYDTTIDGRTGVETPHFDAFAKAGTRFTNSYASVPSCSPSRSSINTGMFPHSNGHWRNTITPKLSYIAPDHYVPDHDLNRETSTVDSCEIFG